MIPIMIGSANSLTLATPKMNSASTMKNVVREVKILLERVSVILSLTRAASSWPLRLERRLSRTRSKMTIVALME